MTDPKKDEHIEELLSKLQGIFGKLSHSEEEEAKHTIEVPQHAPKEKEPEAKEVPKKEAPKEVPVEKVSESPQPLNLYAPPEAAAAEPPREAASSPSTNGPTLPGEGTYETLVPTEDPERLIVPTAVFFPLGRENEAKSLAGKLETMAPKFTKVAFRLRIVVFSPYDPKTEWRDRVVAKSTQSGIQTVFIAVERPMDEAKRKALASDLEAKNVYLQEVPMSMIEKKAFYTDILLGLVFFFDSRKPPAGSEGAAA